MPGRDIYAVLTEATDEQHVHVILNGQDSDYALPLLLRSNGGVGAAGGNGGVGGTTFLKTFPNSPSLSQPSPLKVSNASLPPLTLLFM